MAPINDTLSPTPTEPVSTDESLASNSSPSSTPAQQNLSDVENTPPTDSISSSTPAESTPHTSLDAENTSPADSTSSSTPTQSTPHTSDDGENEEDLDDNDDHAVFAYNSMKADRSLEEPSFYNCHKNSVYSSICGHTATRTTPSGESKKNFDKWELPLTWRISIVPERCIFCLAPTDVIENHNPDVHVLRSDPENEKPLAIEEVAERTEQMRLLIRDRAEQIAQSTPENQVSSEVRERRDAFAMERQAEWFAGVEEVKKHRSHQKRLSRNTRELFERSQNQETAKKRLIHDFLYIADENPFQEEARVLYEDKVFDDEEKKREEEYRNQRNKDLKSQRQNWRTQQEDIWEDEGQQGLEPNLRSMAVDSRRLLKPVKADNETCAICQEQMKLGDDICQLPCGWHKFHYGCISRHFSEFGNSTCPYCRDEYVLNSMPDFTGRRPYDDYRGSYRNRGGRNPNLDRLIRQRHPAPVYSPVVLDTQRNPFLNPVANQQQPVGISEQWVAITDPGPDNDTDDLPALTPDGNQPSSDAEDEGGNENQLSPTENEGGHAAQPADGEETPAVASQGQNHRPGPTWMAVPSLNRDERSLPVTDSSPTIDTPNNEPQDFVPHAFFGQLRDLAGFRLVTEPELVASTVGNENQPSPVEDEGGNGVQSTDEEFMNDSIANDGPIVRTFPSGRRVDRPPGARSRPTVAQPTIESPAPSVPQTPANNDNFSRVELPEVGAAHPAFRLGQNPRIVDGIEAALRRLTSMQEEESPAIVVEAPESSASRSGQRLVDGIEVAMRGLMQERETPAVVVEAPSTVETPANNRTIAGMLGFDSDDMRQFMANPRAFFDRRFPDALDIIGEMMDAGIDPDRPENVGNRQANSVAPLVEGGGVFQFTFRQDIPEAAAADQDEDAGAADYEEARDDQW